MRWKERRRGITSLINRWERKLRQGETRREELGREKKKRWETFGQLNKNNTILWAFVKKRQDGAGRGKARWDITLQFCANPSFQEAKKWHGTVKGEVIITLDFFTLEREKQKRLDRTRWDEIRWDEKRDKMKNDFAWWLRRMTEDRWDQMRWDEMRLWAFYKRKQEKTRRS